MSRGPIDPDVDLRDPREAEERLRLEWDVVAAVALGGVIGAEARYGLGLLVPHRAGQVPWATLLINVTGCLLIGVLMGVLQRVDTLPRLTRPFLGTGVLGGFTTFSAYAVDVDTLVHAGRWGVAAGYLVLTVVACLLAVQAGLVATARRARRR